MLLHTSCDGQLHTTMPPYPSVAAPPGETNGRIRSSRRRSGVSLVQRFDEPASCAGPGHPAGTRRGDHLGWFRLCETCSTLRAMRDPGDLDETERIMNFARERFPDESRFSGDEIEKQRDETMKATEVSLDIIQMMKE